MELQRGWGGLPKHTSTFLQGHPFFLVKRRWPSLIFSLDTELANSEKKYVFVLQS